MLSQSSSKRSLLHGKRVLIIEGDDELYRALAEILAAAGCTVSDCVMLSTWGHSSEVSVWVPDRAVDLALVDNDPGNSATLIWLRHLNDCGIPILITYDPARLLLVPTSRSQRQLRKPFTESELLDSIAELAAFGTRAPSNSLRA